MTDTDTKKIEEQTKDQVRELSVAEIETVGGGCPPNTCERVLSGGWLTCRPC